MKSKKIALHRETLTIDGERKLYVYTFTDASGKTLPLEPTVKGPAGNLDSLKEAEDRKE